MASTSETGHAKNVSNFEKLISFCTSYGTSYNPSKASIKISALNTTLTNVQSVFSTLKTKKTTFDNCTNAREIVFDPNKKLCTRAINSLEATDAIKQTVDDAKTINRKIQGKRGNKSKTSVKVSVDNTTNLSGSVPESLPMQISVSQQSYDSHIDNFDKLIKLLNSEPLYAPNETDLKITSLTATLSNMKTVNTTAINAETAYSNALIARNNTLYADNTGLVDIAKEVKYYVKSVFGARSPQFRQVSKLQFKKIKSGK